MWMNPSREDRLSGPILSQNVLADRLDGSFCCFAAHLAADVTGFFLCRFSSLVHFLLNLALRYFDQVARLLRDGMTSFLAGHGSKKHP
jgi:hypothetical protein